jgi:hypothetical protein
MATKAPGAPIFILCTPRSCSTVCCAMLSQHAALYGFPELNLFITQSVAELLQLQATEERLIGNYAVGYTAGILRVLAELEFGGQTADAVAQARSWLQQKHGLTTHQLLEFILARVAPKRGIDKSPRTSMSRRSLLRMDRLYPEAPVIHLIRDPFASLHSMVTSHLRARPAASAAGSIPPSLVNFYARLWLSTQSLIVEFTRTIPQSRTCRIEAEQLLSTPELTLRNVVEWLKLDDGPAEIEAMLHPERWPYAEPGPPGICGECDPVFLKSPALKRMVSRDSDYRPTVSSMAPVLRDRIKRLGESLGYAAQ